MTLSSHEIRERYLGFFEQKGHRVVKSASLVPEDDPTLLFTTAGMAQFKDAFLGLGRRDYTRAASCQKCLRVGDIDRVGRTAYHHTFFEMLGNFSFGDYFKEEAILWAWELMTQGFKVPESRLQVTVFREDAEARAIWEGKVGLPRSRVHSLGEADNFWPANAPAEGPNGPCGPCSEIYVDRGAESGCGRPDCGPACPCGRFFEVWNLVFTQFNRKDGGVLEPLPRKNIDTGMGLDRLAAALQGVHSNFDTDLFVPLVRKVAEVAGRPYEPRTEDGVRMRRISDHARALAFCITDGVLPSNEGRGYVLRRLLRRAARDGRELGLVKPFMEHLVAPVVTVLGKAYPELVERQATIRQVLTSEEERFAQALEQGSAVLMDAVGEMDRAGRRVMDGETAFRLYDTYGFPLDLIEQVLSERRLEVDKPAFEAALLRQREQSREGSTMKGDVFAVGPVKELLTKVERTKFVGYAKTRSKARIVGFLLEDRLVSSLEAGLKGVMVLDRTPFYAESGGQVGDAGEIHHAKACFEVEDTRVQDGLWLHAGRMARGRLAVGEEVTAEVDRKRRSAVMRHHTATHLLHAALKKVLGPHVEQAGSLVSPQMLRFDFRHPKGLTPEELQKTVNLVNLRALRNEKVVKEVKSIADARAEGATALFGEKYGDEVRVVTVGTFSKELCGGTHCRRSGDIGAFWITSERAVAAGVRRIEAVAGARAVALIRDRERTLRAVASALKSPPEQLEARAGALVEELKQLRRENERLRAQALQSPGGGGGTEEAVETVSGVALVARNLGDGVALDAMRGLSDAIRSRHPCSVVILGASEAGKATLVVTVSEAAEAKGLDAGALVRAALPAIEGRGGGKARFAQAGGAKPAGLDEALRLAREAALARLG